MARYLRADSSNFLATNKNGDYTLTYDATQKFVGDAIIAKRCRDPCASYFKVDQGDKIHLVGIGVITHETNGSYWVAKKVLGLEPYQFVMKYGDNIALTRILVFEMSKDLLSRWRGRQLSLDERDRAKQAIVRDALHRLFKPRTAEDSDDDFEEMDDDAIANLNTEPLTQVFENMLADMLEDEGYDVEDRSESDGTENMNMDVLSLKIC